jgi:type IV pilus assembly protein PilY1
MAMSTYTIKLRTILLAFAVFALTGVPAQADDTEVYLGDLSFSTNILPNVLFIIDTSGSMDDSINLTNGTYDPSHTYTGSCNSSYVYWAASSANGSIPTCPPSTAGRDRYGYFSASSNNCADSATALAAGGTGHYIGTIARYYDTSGTRNDQWQGLIESDHSAIIECAADYGVHGNGGAGVYPANGSNGPYTTNSNRAINWNSTGGVYTLYSANYLNWINTPGVQTSEKKLQIVKDVFSDLVDSTSGINAALMRYDDKSMTLNKGGYFLLPMQKLDSSSRASFKTAANNLTANGYTPLAETLYESALYYRGNKVKFGNSTSPGTNNVGVLDPSDHSKYVSPIAYQCQKNYTILLTDGEPTYDSDADTAINALPDFATTAGTCSFNGNSTPTQDCLDNLAKYLHDYDQRPDLDDKQTVTTYTIGFDNNQQLLQDTANKGGGKYYTADDAVQLSTAFNNAISEILAVNSTFVAPAVPVNSFNRLTNRDELYFALFRPSQNPRWPGNLKRYQLAGSPPIITDANGDPAVDPTTGFFDTASTSFWTPSADAPDGDNVKKGGAAGELTLARNLYTYTGNTAPSNVDLTASAQAFNESNALITKTLLGNAAMTDSYRTSLMQWSRGVDVFDENENGSVTDARRWMGDPLHSTPVAVNYGGTDANPDITLYVATNEGYLHAINTTDGSEQFSFIPQELLPNLDIQYTNNSAVSHPYGLDGQLTVWSNDANNNGVLEDAAGNTETGEFAYLYAGMRRGGDNYYALDVTDRSAPKLKWEITGGTGNFTQLGQSWSKMELAHIKSSGAARTVLLFGGGYDVNQDTETAGTDTTGNAVYMIDADTGARLWWAGKTSSGASLELADMSYSMPAAVMTGDLNADGYTDIMFAVDMGGQVWRFDFNNSGSDTTITGGVVARLDGTNANERRRFYNKPDVSLLDVNGSVKYAVAIGSGYRAHPLSTATQDRFYMLYFGNVYSPPATYTALTESDLVDVTSNLTPDLSTASGWRMDLQTGEKVLANSLTVDGMVFFTTYKPDSSVTNSCAPSQGVGRLYALNAADAAPVQNLDGAGTLANLTLTDRYKTLIRGGIQPEPRLIFTDGDHPVLVVGPEKIDDLDLTNPLKRTSWTDE